MTAVGKFNLAYPVIVRELEVEHIAAEVKKGHSEPEGPHPLRKWDIKPVELATNMLFPVNAVAALPSVPFWNCDVGLKNRCFVSV